MTLVLLLAFWYSNFMKKIIILIACVLFFAVPSMAQGYPHWTYEVWRVEQELFPAGPTQHWFAARRAKEEKYISLCYEDIMKPSSPFVQKAKEIYGEEEAEHQLTALYALIKGRREWLQLEAQNGKLFAPYAIAAGNPMDLSAMSEDTFLRLRALLRLDFDHKSQFADKVERKGNTVYVWFRDWTSEDRVVRLGFEVQEKILDICLNDCEHDPFN